MPEARKSVTFRTFWIIPHHTESDVLYLVCNDTHRERSGNKPLSSNDIIDHLALISYAENAIRGENSQLL